MPLVKPMTKEELITIVDQYSLRAHYRERVVSTYSHQCVMVNSYLTLEEYTSFVHPILTSLDGSDSFLGPYETSLIALLSSVSENRSTKEHIL